VSPLTSFSAIGKNTTNGDQTTYLMSWFTDILTKSDDKIHLILPDEVKIPHAIKQGFTAFICVGRTGFEENGVSCEYKRESIEDGGEEKDALVISLLSVSYKTGLFKVAVDHLINPPSLRGSNPFEKGAIFQTTVGGSKIA